MKDLRIFMTAMGAISGRVFDRDGDPEPNVTVQALKYSYTEGQRTLTQVKVAETNDRGEYRLFWLPPGQYYIRAAPSDGVNMLLHFDAIAPNNIGRPFVGGGETAGVRDRFLPIYFPGTIDLKSAASIDLRSGADYSGVDFTLLREKGRQLRGVILDSKGQPTHAALSLSPRDGSTPINVAAGQADSEGRFTINGVLPGNYILAARSRVENERMTGGRIYVDVGDANVDGLVVALSPSIDIEGRVAIEGVQSATGPDAHPVITLETRNAQGAFAAAEGAQFTDNNSFRMPGVVEGDYEVRFYQLRPGEYVKSIRSGPIDVLSNGLRIDAQSSVIHLEVVIGANGGSIDGVALNDKREPQAEIKVTLIPETSLRQREDRYKNVVTNESGRFQMLGIAPGTYTLLAWEDVEDGAWFDPEFLRRFEGRGTRIRVDEGSKLNIELSPISTTN